MKPFLKLIRPLNCSMAAFAVLIGAYLGGIVSPTPVILAMVATFLICGGGMVVNDYYDRDIDFIHNSHKPIPSGKVSLKAAIVLSMLLFALGIYLSFWINMRALALAGLNSLLLVLYAKDFQKRFLASNITVSFLVASTFVFGGLSIGNFFPALLLGLLAFFANVSREIMKDIEDRLSDSTKDVNSVPIVLGEERSRDLTSVFVIVAIVLSPLPLIFHVFSLMYAIGLVPCIAVFIYSIYLTDKGKNSSKVQSMLKLGMVLGLIAFLLGAF